MADNLDLVSAPSILDMGLIPDVQISKVCEGSGLSPFPGGNEEDLDVALLLAVSIALMGWVPAREIEEVPLSIST